MANELDNPPDVFPLDDKSLMPFGKYKGQRLLNVPPGYLLWFFEQNWARDWPALQDYVEENFDDLSLDAAVNECCVDYEDTF